ncbi:MAG TPA: M20/M25/M40 family metallo-hydrolase [Candidatus Saccharimonadales bacterium]|nr:M20/M25/M40 family metallo-hydrolase [Candidatus Saccharimonadales bacterium]
MTSTESLLKSLISIPSTEQNETEVGEYIYNFLQEEGFVVKKYPVINTTRFNIVASLGNPKVYFQAHLDTVSPFIEYSEDTAFIYGRGACDTKGCIASMIRAAINSKNNRYTDFGLIFTTGEETNLDGARKLMQEDIDIPFVIVGEPTSLEIVNAHYGLVTFTLQAKGKAVHSSIPEQGINAIDILVEMIGKVRNMEIHPETSLTLVKIQGGIAENIVPAEAYAMFSMRTAPEDKIDYIALVESMLLPHITLETLHNFNSVYIEVPEELAFISSRKTVKYFTELSLFQKGIVLGPGDIAHAHGPHEKIPKDELTKAVDIYSQIIHNFCKK